MPNAEYHRKQAELFASLALANTHDPYLMERYTQLARQFLAKADEPDLVNRPPWALRRSGGNDMDRD